MLRGLSFVEVVLLVVAMGNFLGLITGIKPPADVDMTVVENSVEEISVTVFDLCENAGVEMLAVVSAEVD